MTRARWSAAALGLGLGVVSCGNVVVEGATGGGGTGGAASVGPGGSGPGGSGPGGGGSVSASSVGGAGGIVTSQGGGGSSDCGTLVDQDGDGDGFTPGQGDCNDCDAGVSPGSTELPTNSGAPDIEPTDEDCDGLIDEPPDTCDGGIAIDDADPLAAARAIELCQVVAEGAYYGVVSAAWRMPDLTELPVDQLASYHRGHGIVGDFGPHALPAAGEQLLVLSTGAALRPGDAGYASALDKGYVHNHPATLPMESPACGGVVTGKPHDGLALEVEIRAPSNVHGFGFDYRFYTRAWPNDVCLPFNDHFAVTMEPPVPGLGANNVVYDAWGDPVTVSFFKPDACFCPQSCAADEPCTSKASLLGGTGFDENHGAGTGDWIHATVPMDAGETFKLRFLVYDAGDGNADTTALVDRFRWLGPPQPINGGPPGPINGGPP